MALQGPEEVPTELLGFPLQPEAQLLSVSTGSPALPPLLPLCHLECPSSALLCWDTGAASAPARPGDQGTAKSLPSGAVTCWSCGSFLAAAGSGEPITTTETLSDSSLWLHTEPAGLGSCSARAVFRHKPTAGLCFSLSILSTITCYDCIQGHSQQEQPQGG